MSAAFLHLTSLQALTVFFLLLAVLVADAEGRNHVYGCPSFSCGYLRDVSSPFRRRGDPPGCGVPSYELVCTDAKATIRNLSGTFNVVRISYTDSTFWVVESDWGTQRSCLLPRVRHASEYESVDGSPNRVGTTWRTWAIFVNCSQPMENNGIYKPVACLSTNSSFIYVTTSFRYPRAANFEPSCGYLTTTPLGGPGMMVPENASYPDIVKFMRKGFALRFPISGGIGECLAEWMRKFRKDTEPSNSTGINDRIVEILFIDTRFWVCVCQVLQLYQLTIPPWFIPITIADMWILKFILVLCRFVLMPLTVLMFLAHKYWKTRITIDAVEKFLQMQKMLSPTRYAYTDITAVTRHFSDKLGQGGYGSVYKGVLLPGNIHVAVKMLGNSKCNGEEFISEVATIGRIHHINVVRLVGFCSEEMRRALVYEYMPNGSLDKYIFSSEKSFSWDKLNGIALGIARGISYLHQGCDMQIVHFDIKPHNILLDTNFIPKVADFGLARLCPKDNSFMPMSAARGTIGYIAPEMISRSFGVISAKSDVYSFGMLLLEMVGGRRNADPHAESSSQIYYPSWVYNRLTQPDVGEISGAVDMHELEKKLCIVGLWCIQMRPHGRPTMSEVIEMLEGGADALQMPPRPFFCDDETIPEVASYYLSSELNAIEEEDE
ncbi:unnamed protein product [Urochloa decumbens]|uniref:Protein kinase domain-containing protein n=1 Tax=Urochloa decumbens TaxID=240449 RepID=A0ABC8ZTW3_9POAL